MDYAAEDAWWDAHMSAKRNAEAVAMERAISSADLWEFDSDEEREEYIEERFAELMEEYEKTL